MDVEWAHAIAPAANILLVITPSNSGSDLYNGINYATTHGANVVSMSWGGSEFSGETSYDTYFNNPGIIYVASSGDSGAGVQYPAASPYVVGVGGTTLNADSGGNYVSESAWSGSGGGTSAYETEPGYQTNFQSSGYRDVPDVAFDADPNSGVAVCYNGGWIVVGGTSLSAPCWAGLFVLGGLSSVSSVYSQASTDSLYASNYHDITTGSNGFAAGVGYDRVTGLGSPKANNLVPGTANKLSFTIEPSANNTADVVFTTQPVVAVQDTNGNTVTSSTIPVTISITSGTGTAGATLSGTKTVNAANGIVSFNGLSIDKVGVGYTLTAVNSGLTNAISSSFNVVAGPVVKLSVSSYASPATAGVVGNFTVTAQDASGNTITNYTGTVHFTSCDTQADLPANYSFVTGNNGTHTFSATLKTAGSQSITATDTVTASITGSQSGITVSPVAASQIRVETAANGSGNVVSAQNVTSGSSVTAYAITMDQYGNFVANATATWSLINKNGGVSDGDLVAAGDNKSAVFTGHVIGTAAIRVTSTGLISADSGMFTIVAPPSGGGGGGGGGGPIGPTTVAGVTNVTSAVNAQGVFNQDVNLWSDDNNVLLHIPTGTMVLTSSGTSVTQISLIHMATPPAFQAGAGMVTLAYDFTLTGTTFSPMAIVRFSYNPTLIPAGVAESSLQIAYYDSATSSLDHLTLDSGYWQPFHLCPNYPFYTIRGHLRG